MKKTTALLTLLCFATGLLAQQGFIPGYCPAPLRPQSLNITNSSALVKWESPSGYSSFNLQYTLAGQPYGQGVIHYGLSHTLTNLQPNRIYYWRVKVDPSQCNSINASWATGSFTTTICDTPTTLRTETIMATSVKVSWKIVGTARHVVEHKKASESQWTVKRINAGLNYYTFYNLAPGTPYEWRIKSECQLDTTAYVYSQFTTPCDLIPQNLVCGANASNSITAYWSPIPNISNYTVEYRAALSPNWINHESTTNNSTTIAGLQPNTTYLVRVKANCPIGSSNYALTQCATLPPPCETPVLLPSTTGVNTTTIRWSNVPNAVSYLYQYKLPASITWSNEQSINSTSAVLTGLNPSTRYDYRVRTNCAYGLSTYATGQFTTLCTEPVLRTPYGVTTSSATVNWNASTGAGSYSVEYKPQSSATWLTGGITSNTVLTINGLIANTFYDYRVKPDCGNPVVGQFATQPVTSCTVPQGMAVNSITGSTAHVSWTPVSGASSYVLYYSRYGFLPSTITTTNTSLDITNLTPGTDYTVYLSARCGALSSLEVFVPFKTAAASSCVMPSNIGVYAVNPATTTITWGRSAGATNYTVAYKKNTENYFTVTAAGDTSITLPLQSCSNYLVWVQANCGNMSSSYTTKTFTTGGVCTSKYRVAGTTIPIVVTDPEPAPLNNNTASANIYIYPNPVKNNLYVQNIVSGPAESSVIRIFDTKGSLLLQQRMLQRNNAVDVSRLGTGIYILKVSDSPGRITKTHKFVKE